MVAAIEASFIPLTADVKGIVNADILTLRVDEKPMHRDRVDEPGLG
jgi:hypothetical protein